MNKIYWALFLCLLVSCKAHAQIAPVQQVACTVSSSPSVCSLTGLAANQLIVVGVDGYGGFGASPIVDTFGLTWTAAVSCNIYFAGPSNDFLNFYWSFTGTHSGSDTISVQAIDSATAIALVYANPLTTPIVDDGHTCATGTSGSPATISSGSATIGHTGDVIIGLTLNNGTTTVTAGSGFTLQQTNGTGFQVATENKLGSSLSDAATFVQQTAGSVWITNVVAFQIITAKRHKSNVY
jgi:hypothetical protein